MDQDVFENLISSCPELERLTLGDCDGFTHLNIHAPNLLYIDVGGCFDDITFSKTSNLAVVSLELNINGTVERRQARNCSNLLNFFSGLPHITWLGIQSSFLKYLATGIIPGQLLNPCMDLEYLLIHIHLVISQRTLLRFAY